MYAETLLTHLNIINEMKFINYAARNFFSLSCFVHLQIMDEADRILNMDFEEEVLTFLTYSLGEMNKIVV